MSIMQYYITANNKQYNKTLKIYLINLGNETHLCLRL